MICPMAKSPKLSLLLSLTPGSLVIWLSAGQALAHSDEATPHGHQDWRPLIIAGAFLLALFGALGIWRWRCWSRQHQQPEAFVPPPIRLTAIDEDD